MPLDLRAENFELSIESTKTLSNLAAIEIEFAFEPPSYIIDKEFTINLPNVLFKTVDQSQSTIRVFFDKCLAEQEVSKLIQLSGKLTRLNYNGEIKTSIKNIRYISDFSKQINPKDIELKLNISKSAEDEALPYFGISKASILGPLQRMAFNPMLIAIGDIETYGFSLDKSVDELRINGVKARFVSDKIIAASLILDPEQIKSGHIDIELSVKVHGTELKKTIGTLELIESFR